MNLNTYSPLPSAPLSVYDCEEELTTVLQRELELPCAELGWRCSVSLRHQSGFYCVPSSLTHSALVEKISDIARQAASEQTGTKAACLQALVDGRAMLEIELHDQRTLSYRWKAGELRMLGKKEYRKAIAELYQNAATKHSTIRIHPEQLRATQIGVSYFVLVHFVLPNNQATPLSITAFLLLVGLVFLNRITFMAPPLKRDRQQTSS